MYIVLSSSVIVIGLLFCVREYVEGQERVANIHKQIAQEGRGA